jgi:hypothetical protein
MSPLRRTLPGHPQSITYASDSCPPQAHAKNTPDHASERDSEEVQAQRRLPQETIRELDAEACLFLDETGVQCARARPYARSPHGARIPTSKLVNTGQNMTVLGALSLAGIRAAMTGAGRTDAPGCLPSGQTIVVPAWRPGQVVCMDHLSAHQVDGVQEAMESVGARLEYVPPYAPDLSPREKCWSKFNAMLRAKAARTRDLLDQAITEALDMITPQDARGWCAHGGCL